MFSAQLSERGQVALSATGGARLQLGPQHTRERWEVTSVTVRVSPAVLVPSARLYRGTVCDANYTGHGTYTGHQDVATFGNPVILLSGEYLTIVWENGDPLASATMELRGVRIVE